MLIYKLQEIKNTLNDMEMKTTSIIDLFDNIDKIKYYTNAYFDIDEHNRWFIKTTLELISNDKSEYITIYNDSRCNTTTPNEIYNIVKEVSINNYSENIFDKFDYIKNYDKYNRIYWC